MNDEPFGEKTGGQLFEPYLIQELHAGLSHHVAIHFHASSVAGLTLQV